MDRALAGGIAGLAATLPMTIAMKLMHENLPPEEQYPLPPREITEKVAEEAGVDDDMTEDQHRAATLAAHFGYGTACGIVYGIASPVLPGSPTARVIGFGLAVWTGSYLGLLPSLGILKSATEHPARRNALMIAAHVVWGAATGLATETMSDGDEPWWD